jgi:replication-associated recombination protein RarA
MNNQKNLFGEEVAQGYNKYNLISYFLKSLRLRQKETALRLFWIMKHQKISELYIARKLVQFSVEDSVGTEAVNYAWSTYSIVKEFKSEENAIQRLILFLCSSEKMWATEGEHYWELRRIQIREETKRQLKAGKKPLKLPEYVFDQYTAQGKGAMKRGEKIDRRFSGVYEGSGLFMRACHLKWGENQPTYTTKENAYSPHLEQCKKEGLSVDQYLRKHRITIEEFLDL